MPVNYTLYIRDSTNQSKLNENFKENENIINYNDENNNSKETETNFKQKKMTMAGDNINPYITYIFKSHKHRQLFS